MGGGASVLEGKEAGSRDVPEEEMKQAGKVSLENDVAPPSS